jgi:hypothetical protein
VRVGIPLTMVVISPIRRKDPKDLRIMHQSMSLQVQAEFNK